MAAMSIWVNYSEFIQSLAVGLADTTALMVGVLYGEMNDEGIRESSNCVLRSCARFCGLACVLLLIFARPVARIYVREEGALMEMAVNIIKHGFPKCKKHPGINLRVVYDDENLILRLQDNCPVFDVERESALAMHQGTAAPERQIGLKILSAMAPDIKYVHTLETNNVIVRIGRQVQGQSGNTTATFPQLPLAIRA